MDDKKRIAELEKQNTQLADHLANMCCQADEDCPAEYRTKHFRSTMNDAYDYLKEIGYLKWVESPGSRCKKFILAIGAGSRLRDQATSDKPQAASVRLQAWQD